MKINWNLNFEFFEAYLTSAELIDSLFPIYPEQEIGIVIALLFFAPTIIRVGSFESSTNTLITFSVIGFYRTTAHTL